MNNHHPQEPPSSTTAESDPALQEITTVLQQYFDGLYASDSAAMRAIFHPQAVYATADEEPSLIRDMPTYLSIIEQRESPMSRGETRSDHIDSIDIAGKNTARAQVRCSIASRDFVDYLTLIHDNGDWRIIAKVFQTIERGNTHAIR
ncbi:MAG: nuclear transport factor 2 family protein [Halioglobus sp.]